MTKKHLSKELLYQKYIIEGKTNKEIAKELNCHKETIFNYVKKYNLRKFRKGNFNNLTGKRFGKLFIIKEIDKDNRGKILWLCKCDCGKEKIILGDSLKNNKTKSCGCLSIESKYKGYYELSMTYWNKLKYGAKARNWIFSIKIEDIWNLFIKQDRKCALSGLPLYFSNATKLSKQTASLDRIDSSKGYIEGNVQWVHKAINRMKNILSQQEILYICKLIYLNNQIESDLININLDTLNKEYF